MGKKRKGARVQRSKERPGAARPDIDFITATGCDTVRLGLILGVGIKRKVAKGNRRKGTARAWSPHPAVLDCTDSSRLVDSAFITKIQYHTIVILYTFILNLFCNRCLKV